MPNLFSNDRITIKLCCIFIVMFAVNANANNHLSFQEVQKPVYNRSPENLSFYVDQSGNPGLAYKYTDSSTPGEMFYTRLVNSKWVEAQATNALNVNDFQFSNVAALTSSSNMMLLRGDDTDYMRVFGLTAVPPSPANDTDPIISGTTNDELRQILMNNQRLFFSLNNGVNWSSPQVVPGTNKAQNAVLYSDGNGTAMAVYSIDADNNETTLNDIDLYYVFYANNVWQKPVRLTNNSQIDYGVQITFLNGKYIVTWVLDEDSNPNTVSDSRLYYGIVTSAGAVNTSATPMLNKPNANPFYTLGSNAAAAIVLWSVKQADGSYLLQEMRYTGGSWSAMQSSKISSPSVSNGKIFDVNGNLILLFRRGRSINIAHHNGAEWQLKESINDLIERNISVAEVEYAIVNNTLWLAYSGHIAAVNEGQDPNIGDGLYVASYTLSYDLSLSFSGIKPRVLNVGQDVELSLEVENKGLLSSSAYTLQLWSQDQLLTTLNGSSLSVGAKQGFKYTHNIQDIETPINAILVPGADDKHSSNNAKEFVLKVRPDFYIKSINKTDAATIIVDIRERKAITTSSPAIEVYLIQGETQTLVARSIYNPSSMGILTLTSNELSTVRGPYKVLVKVNPTRDILEDDYSNNSNVYEFRPATKPDYTITNLSVTDSSVFVTLKNSGILSTAPVDLLITDNPEQAAQQTTISSPWHFQRVTLDPTGNAAITIQRSALPQITGQYLYAVVNPYNAMPEIERNNNMAQKLVVPTIEPSGGVTISYRFKNYLCSNLSFDLTNTGNSSAKHIRATLANADGIVLATSQLPLLLSGQAERLTFHNVDLANYVISIDHIKDNKPVRLFNQPINLNSDDCPAHDNSKDVNLSALSYLGINANTGLSEFDIDLRMSGYPVDYRKPLIRIPLVLEVKRGTTLVTTLNKVVYASPTKNQNILRIRLAGSEIPTTGGYTLIVKVPSRMGEAQTSNNTLATRVN